jgi:Uma2 family endonuclease
MFHVQCTMLTGALAVTKRPESEQMKDPSSCPKFSHYRYNRAGFDGRIQKSREGSPISRPVHLNHMSTSALKRLTWQEYLAFERASETKHEFFDGEVFAMSGGTFSHAAIIGNITWSLKNALRDRKCAVLPNDMRVLTPSGLSTYPDVVVTCGPEFDDEQKDTLVNPITIFGVLSRTTEGYNRGRKFVNYRTIESLKDYVLVSQHQPLVEHFAREEGTGRWVLTTYDTLEAVVDISSLGIRLPMIEIYAQINFEETADEMVPDPPA